MCITVFSDCHWHGPTPIEIEPEFGSDIFYIGDNHEFKNIRKKNIENLRKLYIAFLEDCKNSGTKVLNGNHEVKVGYELNNVEVLFTEDKSTAFVHFHRESWPEDDVRKWHNKEPGKSKIKIFLIKQKNLIRNKMGAKKLKKNQISICKQIAKKYNVNTVIFGHTHPKALIIEQHDDINMINVPRGKTILNHDSTGWSKVNP